jgi:hypothetical protein
MRQQKIRLWLIACVVKRAGEIVGDAQRVKGKSAPRERQSRELSFRSSAEATSCVERKRRRTRKLVRRVSNNDRQGKTAVRSFFFLGKNGRYYGEKNFGGGVGVIKKKGWWGGVFGS